MISRKRIRHRKRQLIREASWDIGPFSSTKSWLVAMVQRFEDSRREVVDDNAELKVYKLHPETVARQEMAIKFDMLRRINKL